MTVKGWVLTRCVVASVRVERGEDRDWVPVELRGKARVNILAKNPYFFLNREIPDPYFFLDFRGRAERENERSELNERSEYTSGASLTQLGVWGAL